MKTLQKYTKQLVALTVVLLILLFLSLVPNVMSVIADLSGAIGLVVGALISFMGVFFADSVRNKDRQHHRAALLFSELQSIENYLRTPFSELTTNIRYWDQWPDLVAGCDFLNPSEVQTLYSLYDLVYAYNQLYPKSGAGEGDKKAAENLHTALGKEILSSPYTSLTARLNTVKNQA